MRDDFTTAAWADNHDQLAGAMRAMFRKAAHAFERLQAIAYDAPWRHARH